MIEIVRQGLSLTISQGIIPSQGSSKVPVRYINEDDHYADYLVMASCGWFNKGFKSTLIDVEGDTFYLPFEAFERNGFVCLAVTLIDPQDNNHKEVTKEVTFEVTKAPITDVKLPPKEQWESAVSKWLEELYNKDYANRFESQIEELKVFKTEIKKEIDSYNTIQLQQNDQISSIKLKFVVTSGSLYDPNMNKEVYFWDEEVRKGTLAKQTADDIWHYQIRLSGTWTDLPENALKTNNNGEKSWMNANNTSSAQYHWAKMAKSGLTTTFNKVEQEAIAFAWCAPKSGYYKATLERAIAESSTSGLDGFVFHSSTSSNGTELYRGAFKQGQTFESKIAKVNKGDWIRIGASTKDAWASGFYPMVVEVSKEDYDKQEASQG